MHITPRRDAPGVTGKQTGANAVFKQQQGEKWGYKLAYGLVVEDEKSVFFTLGAKNIRKRIASVKIHW